MRATNSKKLDCHTTYLNKHLGFVRFSDFLVLWGFFKGNQSNKQEETPLPDNAFEQTPWICGILGFCWDFWDFWGQSEQQAGRSLSARQRVWTNTLDLWDFLGLLGFFKGHQSNMQEEACLPDNVLEQTPRICGILGLEIQSQEIRFLKTYINVRACINGR